MQQDIDLIRYILLNLENEKEDKLKAFSQEQIAYHKYLVMRMGLAEGADMTGLGDKYPSAILTGLTWEGHDFLNAARNETVWKRVMIKIKKSAGTVPFDVLKTLLIKDAILPEETHHGNIYIQVDFISGDQVGGDKVGGDKINIENIKDTSGVEIGSDVRADTKRRD